MNWLWGRILDDSMGPSGFDRAGLRFFPIAVSLARENADRRGSVTFSVKSIYDLDSTTDGAPLLVCCEVLEHLENRTRR